MEGYIASKRRIFARQGIGDLAVIGVDTPAAAETCTVVSARGGPYVAPVAIDRVIGRGIYALDGVLYDGLYSPPAEIVDLTLVIGKYLALGRFMQVLGLDQTCSITRSDTGALTVTSSA
jgi:hypothetical protein